MIIDGAFFGYGAGIVSLGFICGTVYGIIRDIWYPRGR